MKVWLKDEGKEFHNSDVCFGWEYTPESGVIDVARIMIRGEYPAGNAYGYLEESHEIATVVRGSGYVEVKDGDRQGLSAGDVVYITPMERFRWGGDMDLVISCDPAFDPSKHKIEEA